MHNTNTTKLLTKINKPRPVPVWSFLAVTIIWPRGRTRTITALKCWCKLVGYIEFLDRNFWEGITNKTPDEDGNYNRKIRYNITTRLIRKEWRELDPTEQECTVCRCQEYNE